MGRLETQWEPIATHFSHPHPLHLTNPQPNQPSRRCSACKQTLEREPFYACKAPPCATYSLHLNCSQLPRRITHPCHHHHPLSLLTESRYPNGGFICNACGKNGHGFSYHCKDCEVIIDVSCARLPLSVSHQSHHHPLNLVFLPPYGSNCFSCDVCGGMGGSKCWLYRCGLCGFDAHLWCASSKAQVVGGIGRSNGRENLIVNPLLNGGTGGGAGEQFLQAMMNNGGNVNNQFLQSMLGGGGSNMNNQLLQAIMGGGGGGANPVLQGMMGGGGGGGNPFLQGMMGGGSGGGGDLLQALLNGSNGGLDLSSVLGNVGGFGGLMGGGFGGFGF